MMYPHHCLGIRMDRVYNWPRPRQNRFLQGKLLGQNCPRDSMTPQDTYRCRQILNMSDHIFRLDRNTPHNMFDANSNKTRPQDM